jgi:hypothetical protein
MFIWALLDVLCCETVVSHVNVNEFHFHCGFAVAAMAVDESFLQHQKVGCTPKGS